MMNRMTMITAMMTPATTPTAELSDVLGGGLFTIVAIYVVE